MLSGHILSTSPLTILPVLVLNDEAADNFSSLALSLLDNLVYPATQFWYMKLEDTHNVDSDMLVLILSALISGFSRLMHIKIFEDSQPFCAAHLSHPWQIKRAGMNISVLHTFLGFKHIKHTRLLKVLTLLAVGDSPTHSPHSAISCKCPSN